MLIGESGEVIDEGESDEAPVRGAGTDQALVQEEHEPDDNGIDDPPVAVDDPVTARTGAAVPIAVTANDYDPDGEAIALSAVGEAAPRHGRHRQRHDRVVPARATNYVGVDQFEYTIVDGNGTEASATVTIELLPIDTVNRAPVGSPDVAETGDRTRRSTSTCCSTTSIPNATRCASTRSPPPDIGGTVTETTGPSGLPGAAVRAAARRLGHGDVHLPPGRLVRRDRRRGRGARSRSPSRATPTARRSCAPTALRVRRDVAGFIAGARQRPAIPTATGCRSTSSGRCRHGLDVAVRGDEIQVVVRAGAARLLAVPVHGRRRATGIRCAGRCSWC